MKRTIPTLYLSLLLTSFCSSISFGQFKVVGYLPTWKNPATAIASVDLDKVTHINIAFANPSNANGTTLTPSDGVTGANVTTIVNACHAKNVKVFMSIGGATNATVATRYQGIMSTPAKRTTFVTTLKNYVATYNLDGIDVDIEGDVLDGNYVTAAQYELFIKELTDTLHARNKLVSAALATWFADFVTNTAASKFDWINIMSYDAYGPWSGPGAHSPYSLAVSDFQYWNGTKGMPANKLTVGVPFYGYGWGTYQTDDELTYCTIANTYANGYNMDQIGSGANRISYNGLPTMKLKTKYALEHASGIMIWEILSDCATSNTKSLLRAIDSMVTLAAIPTAVVASQLSQESLNVFPNPATRDLSVQLNLSANSTGNLVLCDMNGQVLQQLASGTMQAQDNFTIALENYPTGLYILKLSTDQGTVARKIVKQ